MTLVQFRARFPEFAKLPDPMVQDALNRGAAQTGSVFGTLTDESIGYLAAHFLALSPYGGQARLEINGQPTTTYMVHWKRLARLKAAGVGRITGGNNYPWGG